jgi:hypothetical protein
VGYPQAAGRGGWGNITQDKPLTEDEKKELAARDLEDEAIIRKHYTGEPEHPWVSRRVSVRRVANNQTTGRHSTGKGGYGNIHAAAKDSPNGLVDLSALTLEEKEAYEKVHANDKKTGFSTGKGEGFVCHEAYTSLNPPPLFPPQVALATSSTLIPTLHPSMNSKQTRRFLVDEMASTRTESSITFFVVSVVRRVEGTGRGIIQSDVCRGFV